MRSFRINREGVYNYFNVIKLKSKFFLVFKLVFDILIISLILIYLGFFFEKKSYYFSKSKLYYYQALNFVELLLICGLFLTYYIKNLKIDENLRFKKFFKKYLLLQIIFAIATTIFLFLFFVLNIIYVIKRHIRNSQKYRITLSFIDYFNLVIAFLPIIILHYLKITKIKKYFSAKNDYDNILSN